MYRRGVRGGEERCEGCIGGVRGVEERHEGCTGEV